MPAPSFLAASPRRLRCCSAVGARLRHLGCCALIGFTALSLMLPAVAPAAEPHRCVVAGKVIITDSPCEEIGASDAPAKPPAVRADTVLVAPAAGRNENERGLITMSSGIGLLLLGLALAAAFTGWWPSRRASPREATEPSARTSGPDNENEAIPYAPASLMNAAESAFLYHLRGALPEFEVFPQVPLTAFVRIDRNRAGDDIFTNGYRWQNRINQQRVDFLVCHQADMTPLAVIELDDPSQDNEDARRRERNKARNLQLAGIPLLRWRIESLPDLGEIRRELGLEQSAARRSQLPANLPGKRRDS